MRAAGDGNPGLGRARKETQWMGKDMGYRVGKGGHSQREGPGAARRTRRRSSCQGTEGGGPGGGPS